MSSVVDKVTEAASSVASFVTGKDAESSSDPGSFSKPADYPSQTQRGRAVGIEAEMGNKPIYNMHEGDDGLEPYKAAGKLLNKKALITGGDSGIGRSVAVLYAMEGADVAIVYLPEEQQDALEVQAEVAKTGRQCLLLPADIRTEESCNRVVKETVAAFGKIDILVNNAGVMYSTESIEDITTEQFDRTVKTNIYGTFFITRAAVPHIPKGGSIIVTVSQVAYAGSSSLIDYSMTKGAGVGLVRALSQNLLTKGIRVNGVAPGPVWTPLQPAAMDKKTLDSWQNSPAPIGRIGQPIECGTAFVYLASKDASFFTGQVLHPNGGKVLNT